MASFSGYHRIAANLQDLKLCGNRVAIKEDLDEKVRPNGLIVPATQATVVGRVLLVGDKLEDDIYPGETVLYERWQGGRWMTADGVKMLIMDADKVLAVLEYS
jgi:co-chaperonin GroES (HSP10)